VPKMTLNSLAFAYESGSLELNIFSEPLLHKNFIIIAIFLY
jgi:hypothetical protein